MEYNITILQLLFKSYLLCLFGLYDINIELLFDVESIMTVAEQKYEKFHLFSKWLSIREFSNIFLFSVWECYLYYKIKYLSLVNTSGVTTTL